MSDYQIKNEKAMDTTSRNNIVRNPVNKVQGRTKQLHFLITSATTVHPPLLKWVGATIKVLARSTRNQQISGWKKTRKGKGHFGGTAVS